MIRAKSNDTLLGPGTLFGTGTAFSSLSSIYSAAALEQLSTLLDNSEQAVVENRWASIFIAFFRSPFILDSTKENTPNTKVAVIDFELCTSDLFTTLSAKSFVQQHSSNDIEIKMPAQYQRVKRQDPASSEAAATSEAPAASSAAPASSEAAATSAAPSSQGKSTSRLVAERHRVTH